MRALLPPPLQGKNPEAEKMQQVIAQLTAQLKEATDKMGLEARKTDIDAYNAETNRLKVVGAQMGPAEIQALVIQTMRQVVGSPDPLPNTAPMMPAQPGSV